MGFKNFFRREQQEEAKDKRNDAKRKARKADYDAWLAEQQANERVGDVVTALDAMLAEYGRLQDEAFGYTSRRDNQKRAILKLLEDNRELLLTKHQTVKMRGYSLGYTVHSDVRTSDKFSLKKYLEEFKESSVAFNLSKTTIKGAMDSSTMREHLEDLGVELHFKEDWDIRDYKDWLEY